jgi:hypothetical protein
MNANVLVAIQTIAQIAAEANVAVGVVFGLFKAVRDNWPFASGETPIPDAELIAIMRAEFKKNVDRNAQLIAEIEAGGTGV